MDGVLDRNGESDRLSALGVFMPVRDDIADQIAAVHPLGELAFNVVAALSANTAQIGIAWCIDPRAN